MSSKAFAALLLLAFTSSSSATWCVCKEGSDTILQKTLDYACGAGADCNPLHQNGPCFQPNTVRAHCNYAVNSYFQKKSQAQGSCDFAGTATVTASDPSSAGCSYPASSSAGTGTNSGTKTPSGISSSSPYSSTAGVLGGIGSDTNPDESNGGLINTTFFISFFSFFIAILSCCC
ncbi:PLASMODESMATA CALLOSE-BINDING PROTEIN 3-like isoform X2 [Vigna unguiculata]|uniref:PLASMODESMATA CALLOSE-BINDING PROTEIN 3-like isoform X2 n=1 Tax=Vigna unguiculata TaxID=3917 RepID=UPI0010163EB4|nr:PLASMODESMATA CALLOSE-BINDING PROTEIN 3-like isoform X2 [Vigna unguiculata]